MPTQGELQKIFDQYVAAYQAKDAKGCAAVFMPDARMMSPYGPIAKGRSEIEARHVEWTRDGGGNKRLLIVEFGGSGDLAWALAEFSEGKNQGGTSLCVFERQSDGGWLIRMSSLNANRAAR